MISHYDLEICEISIYKNYVINKFKEGAHLEVHQALSLKTLINNDLNNQPYVYISNRINSYSFDPMVYNVINDVENMLVMIVITNSKTKQDIVQFEKRFSKKKLMIFEHLDNAISWVKEYFKKKNI